MTELEGETESGFLVTLETLLQHIIVTGGQVASWPDVISALRRAVLPSLSDSRQLQRAENVWLQAQVLIGETAQHAQRYQAAQADQQHRVLAEIESHLITTFDVAELMNLMSKISQLRGAGDHAEMIEAVSLSDYRLRQGEV